MALDYPRLGYPVDVHRRIDRNWLRRTLNAPERAKSVMKHDRAASCPACRKPAPIAPIASVYRGGGLVHHHWLCTPCGHTWTTEVQVTGADS